MDTRRGNDLSQRELRWRRVKRGLLQARRLMSWTLEPHALEHGQLRDFPHVHARVVRPIRRGDRSAHPLLEAGKRTNVALAAPAFDGLSLGREGMSFWRTLGPIRARDGYEQGMELAGGCIVPALGGGICLLGNALFEAAAWGGWRVLERHGHTTEAIPDASRPWGLDATLSWPQVDLRIAPRRGRGLVRTFIEDERLVVELRGQGPRGFEVEIRGLSDRSFEEDGHRVRTNTLMRSLRGPGVHVDEVLGHNRKRLLHEVEQRRSCLTCGQLACKQRPSNTPHLPLRSAA